MTEAKYELKNWTRWKRTVQLLEETRNELSDMKKGINIDLYEMPGGNHQPINDKFNKIIEQRDQYDEIIKEYNFFINRLENAIANLLNEEQREICIIYANHPKNSRKRELEAIKKGYARTTYYEILNNSINILDKYLSVFDNRRKYIKKVEDYYL